MKTILAIVLILVIAGVLFGDLSLSINMFNIGQSMSIASGGAGTWSATQTTASEDLTGKIVGFVLVVVVIAVITKPKRKQNKWD